MTSTSNVAPKNTPWGEVQFEWQIIPGFIQIETSGHGGIWLNAEQAAKIPAYLKKYSFSGQGIWWEEDCAWSLPMLYFLSRKELVDHEEYILELATETARQWYLSAYRTIMRNARAG